MPISAAGTRLEPTQRFATARDASLSLFAIAHRAWTCGHTRRRRVQASRGLWFATSETTETPSHKTIVAARIRTPRLARAG